MQGMLNEGYFDNRLLTYPEPLDEARSRTIEQLHDTAKSYIDSLDPRSLRDELPPEVREKLKSFGAFGALVPKEFGGQGWSFTEFARFMEAFGSNLSLAAVIAAHNCTVVHSIMEHGSEELKSKYLPKLATGEYLGAFAFTETKSGSDLESSNCRGRQLLGENHMEIQGEKVFVTGGNFANLFLTLVSVKSFSSELADKDSQLSIVIVERDFPGVIVNKSSFLRGLHGNGLASVNFNNVRVSHDQVVGKPGDAGKICRDLHNPLKCTVSAAVLGALKTTYIRVLSDVNAKTHLSRPLAQDLIIQRKIADMATNMYAIESAVYFHTAITDCVEKHDGTIEMSIVGLSGLKYATSFAETCVELYGPEAHEEGHFANALLRDINCLLWFYQSENLLRLLIAMASVKITGAIAHERIRCLRDPLTYPKEWFKILWNMGGWRMDTPTDKSPFEDLVHASLKSQANAVYWCHGELKEVLSTLLQTYGAAIFESEVALSRLTDMINDVHLATTALARLNRSVTQGSESADLEIHLFQSILDKARETLANKKNSELLLEASVVQTEVDVFEKLVNDGRYTFEHPLMRNFG